MNYLMILAIAPGLIFLFLVWRLDTIEKEPPKLLGKLVLMGFISTIPALIIEILLSKIFTGILNENTLFYLIIDNFIGVAIVEEGVKYFFLKKCTWKSKEFNYLFDGIVYAVCVSMGFAILENIFYVIDNGLATAIVRAVTSIPGHGVFAIMMGHYYGMARFQANKGNGDLAKKWLIKALVVPTLVHGFYDFVLSFESAIMVLVFYVFIIGLFVYNYKKIKKVSAADINIEPADALGIIANVEPNGPNESNETNE